MPERLSFGRRSLVGHLAGLDMNYDNYTGDKFPALSGCSVPHACFSYIFDPIEFKKSPMYSAMMASKMDAITRYLKKNLSTQVQVLDVFQDFFEHVQNKLQDTDNTPE